MVTPSATPSDIKLKMVEVHDFSNEPFHPSESFEQCIAIFTGIQICANIDPTNLSGTLSAKVFGVEVRALSYKVGEPAVLGFDAKVGSATVTVSVYLNSNGKHCIKLQCKITAAFFNLLNKDFDLCLPF